MLVVGVVQGEESQVDTVSASSGRGPGEESQVDTM